MWASVIAPIKIEQAHHLKKGDEDNVWVSEGNDPQFILQGPFEPGFWELELLASSYNDAPPGNMQIYFAPNGDFKEEWSVSFPSISSVSQERRLKFYLPFRASSLRLDPSETAGKFFLQPVRLSRKRLFWVVIMLIRNQLGGKPSLKRLNELPKAIWKVVNGNWGQIVSSQLAAPNDNTTYKTWLSQRLDERAKEYPFEEEEGLFSLITTVYDTPANFLLDLAESIRKQSFQGFEWIILDNGSCEKGTIATLQSMQRSDNKIRLFKVKDNLGIVGGMSYVLERSKGRYIVPIDSDDRLFDDSLAIVASTVQQAGYPPLLYTDEDKLENNQPNSPFFKPDWDPVLLRNCCYIAHLCVIDRKWASKLGVYENPSAEGCHDWDTFLKFTRAGISAVHISEIIYSWRMHQQSTAANISSKSFITDSHRQVLQTHIEQCKLDNILTVEPSPFFPNSPDWWFRRRRLMGPELSVVILADHEDLRSLQGCLSSLSSYGKIKPVVVSWPKGRQKTALTNKEEVSLDAPLPFKVTFSSIPGLGGLRAAALDAVEGGDLILLVLFASCMPVGDEWVWEAIGLKESFPDALLIGGRTIDLAGQVITAGRVFGFQGATKSPDAGLNSKAPGYFGLALKQHSVSAVTASICGIDPAFLVNVCDGLPESLTAPDDLGLFLSAEVQQAGGRVIYSPFISAEALFSADENSGNNLAAEEFMARYGNQVPDYRYYNRFLDMSASNPYNVKIR